MSQRKQVRRSVGMGPELVLRGTLLMSFLLGIALYSLAQQIQPAEGATADQPHQETSEDPAGCKVSDRFPQKVRQWCDLITSQAEENELPPDLIAALIWQESGGNPLAYSRSGAVGLMQVMPRDGLAAQFICQNGPCFASRPTIAELQDPEFNVTYGTRILAGLNRRFGDLRQALKAYGPSGTGYSYADTVLALYEKYGEE